MTKTTSPMETFFFDCYQFCHFCMSGMYSRCQRTLKTFAKYTTTDIVIRITKRSWGQSLWIIHQNNMIWRESIRVTIVSSDGIVIGRLFKMYSTLHARVLSDSTSKVADWSLSRQYRISLTEQIIRSQNPPWCVGLGGLNIHRMYDANSSWVALDVALVKMIPLSFESISYELDQKCNQTLPWFSSYGCDIHHGEAGTRSYYLTDLTRILGLSLEILFSAILYGE